MDQLIDKRFELLDILGEGSHAVVWKAHDTKLNRDVALKLIRSGVHDSELYKRFEQETQAAARLSHDNIVTLLEAGNDHEFFYIAYQLVEGVTLREWIAFVGSSQMEIAVMLAGVANAIAYAHRKGIIHRDIKPENILVDLSGKPFVTDFGLAQISDKRITEADISVGTIAYVSPEQCCAMAIDGRADQFSLGVVLFESLTGMLPFRGVTRAEYLAQLTMSAAPNPVTINRNIHADLAAICCRCLSRDVAYRYETMNEVEADLRRFSTGQPTIARPLGVFSRFVRLIHRHRIAFILITFGLISVSTLATVAFLNSMQLSNETENKWKKSIERVRIDKGVQLERTVQTLLEDGVPTDRLRQSIESATPDESLSLLFALSKCGSLSPEEVTLLFKVIPAVLPDRARGVANTLEGIKREDLVQEYRRHIRSDASGSVPLAVSGMFVGIEEHAIPIVAIQPSGSHRRDLISLLAKCDLALDDWQRLLDTEDEELRASVITAIAEAPHSDLNGFARIIEELHAIRKSTDHSGTHSAASYAITSLEDLETYPTSSKSDSRRNWFTHCGLTFVLIPPGSLKTEDNRHLFVDEEFYISTKEFPRSLIVKWFEHDQSMRRAVTGLSGRNFDDNVAGHQIGVVAAMKICNKLSSLDGRSHYYKDIHVDQPSNSKTDPESTGYRIPTVKQWEWAARCKTTTKFFYGSANDDANSSEAESLKHLATSTAYGWFSPQARWNPDFRPSGRKRPNSWGLFDVYGNVAELATTESGYTFCGGTVIHSPYECSSGSFAEMSDHKLDLFVYGLRVVCPKLKGKKNE